MRLLVLDTCGVTANVVLAEDDVVVAREAMPGRSASERLVTVVRELLDGTGWRLGDLAGIGVMHGPGSFTGVRIGVSAAKGMGEASGVGLVAVSRLELFQWVSGSDVVALDAGRGELYVRQGAVEQVMTRAALAVLQREVAVFEDGLADTLRKEMEVRLHPMPSAAGAVDTVGERVRAGTFDDRATLDANYVRRSEGLYGRASK